MLKTPDSAPGRSKKCPKITLEGTRLTLKTDIAFALNEHPRLMGDGDVPDLAPSLRNRRHLGAGQPGRAAGARVSADFFAYGTLAFPPILEALTGRSFPSVAARVHDHEALLVKDRIYPGLMHAPGIETPGRLYLGLDDDTMAILDAFEDEIYERLTLPVVSEDGRTVAADVYVMPSRHRQVLTNQTWQPDVFLRLHGEAYRAMCREFRRQKQLSAGRRAGRRQG